MVRNSHVCPYVKVVRILGLSLDWIVRIPAADPKRTQDDFLSQKNIPVINFRGFSVVHLLHVAWNLVVFHV